MTSGPSEIRRVAVIGTGVIGASWAALFFFFAVSGLVSIGAMGAIAPRPQPRRITLGE